MPRPLYLLMLCNLVLGTGVFVLGGILAPLAESLQVSVAAAGQAMTAYAIATALLAPLLLVLTGRWPRRRVLVFGLLLFALGNFVCASAQSLATLLVGRVLMGMGAVFTPVSGSIAIAIAPPAQRGRALSLVFLGISLSYVIGMPLGAWWAARLALPVGLVGPARAAALRCAVLRRHRTRGSFAGLSRLLIQPAIAAALALTLLYFSAIFTVFTYIGPVLQALSPMSAEQLSLTLMMFGLSGVAGTLLGGWANDRFGSRRPGRSTGCRCDDGLLPLTAAPARADAVAGLGHGRLRMMAAAIAAGGLALTQTPVLLSLNASMLYLGTPAAPSWAAGVRARISQLSPGVPPGAPALPVAWPYISAHNHARSALHEQPSDDRRGRPACAHTTSSALRAGLALAPLGLPA
jgi:DHA1 family inner membrane transport protein